MSKTGDINRLNNRRAKITANAIPCPVCGRPVVFRRPLDCSDKIRLIRPRACSTTCGVLLAQREKVANANPALP